LKWSKKRKACFDHIVVFFDFFRRREENPAGDRNADPSLEIGDKFGESSSYQWTKLPAGENDAQRRTTNVFYLHFGEAKEREN
jgi:hypothetical protein